MATSTLPKHSQMDFDGLSFIATEFVGNIRADQANITNATIGDLNVTGNLTGPSFITEEQVETIVRNELYLTKEYVCLEAFGDPWAPTRWPNATTGNYAHDDLLTVALNYCNTHDVGKILFLPGPDVNVGYRFILSHNEFPRRAPFYMEWAPRAWVTHSVKGAGNALFDLPDEINGPRPTQSSYAFINARIRTVGIGADEVGAILIRHRNSSGLSFPGDCRFNQNRFNTAISVSSAFNMYTNGTVTINAAGRGIPYRSVLRDETLHGNTDDLPNPRPVSFSISSGDDKIRVYRTHLVEDPPSSGNFVEEWELAPDFFDSGDEGKWLTIVHAGLSEQFMITSVNNGSLCTVDHLCVQGMSNDPGVFESARVTTVTSDGVTTATFSHPILVTENDFDLNRSIYIPDATKASDSGQAYRGTLATVTNATTAILSEAVAVDVTDAAVILSPCVELYDQPGSNNSDVKISTWNIEDYNGTGLVAMNCILLNIKQLATKAQGDTGTNNQLGAANPCYFAECGGTVEIAFPQMYGGRDGAFIVRQQNDLKQLEIKLYNQAERNVTTTSIPLLNWNKSAKQAQWLGDAWVVERPPFDPIKGRLFHDDFDFLSGSWATFKGTDTAAHFAAIPDAKGRSILSGTTGDDAAASIAANAVQISGPLSWMPTASNIEIEFDVSLSAVSAVSVFIGMTDQNSILEMPIYSAGSGNNRTSDASNAVGIMFDTSMSGDNWWLTSVAADADSTAQNTGVAPIANTTEKRKIRMYKNGEAVFYRNDWIVGRAIKSAFTPTVLYSPVICAFSRSTSSKTVNVDYFRITQKLRNGD